MAALAAVFVKKMPPFPYDNKSTPLTLTQLKLDATRADVIGGETRSVAKRVKPHTVRLSNVNVFGAAFVSARPLSSAGGASADPDERVSVELTIVSDAPSSSSDRTSHGAVTVQRCIEMVGDASDHVSAPPPLQ